MDARSYTVGAKLSDGPFGALHEGVHPQTQARVLLRILPAALNKDGKALSRLKGLKKSVQRFLTGQSQGDPSAAPDPVPVVEASPIPARATGRVLLQFAPPRKPFAPPRRE